MRVLALDIECAPGIVYAWGRFKQFIPPEAVIQEPYILCFTYQWEDQKTVKFSGIFDPGKDEMLSLLRDLLDEADVVVHYNGKTFDVPWITGELIEAGLTPPSPFKQIDLYQTVRQTRWFVKKLDTAAGKLLGEGKVKHQGFLLWPACMAGDEKAWKTMKRYAIQDTKLLFPLYHKLRPWIKNHPNRALYDGIEMACNRCSSTNVQRRGKETTGAGTFPRYQCQDCGGWFRGPKREETNEVRGI